MYNSTSLVTNCGNRVHCTAAAPVHLRYHTISQFSLPAVQQNGSCSKTAERGAQCSLIFCSTWTIRDGLSLLIAQHLPGIAEHEFSKQASQSSRLTQPLNRIIKECLVCWNTLNGHRQVEVNYPHSRRPWSTSTRDDKRQQQFDSKGQNYTVLRDCPPKSCWVFAVHSTRKELATLSRCHIPYYARKTRSLSREDVETLIRYKKPYIMRCSYKFHISSQKSVGNGLRPIRTWQTFLLGLEIHKSALPDPFPPSQPSPRGGVLMLSPLWKKLFDFSHC